MIGLIIVIKVTIFIFIYCDGGNLQQILFVVWVTNKISLHLKGSQLCAYMSSFMLVYHYLYSLENRRFIFCVYRTSGFLRNVLAMVYTHILKSHFSYDFMTIYSCRNLYKGFCTYYHCAATCRQAFPFREVHNISSTKNMYVFQQSYIGNSTKHLYAY